MISVLVIDNNPVFRLGLKGLLQSSQADLHLVGTERVSQGREILRTVPDVALVLLDLDVPDCGGFVGVFQLRNEVPHIPIIVLSDQCDSELISRALAFGAAGYISKSSPCEEISRTLQAVLTQKQWSQCPVVADRERVNPISSLSPAQLKVLRGLQKGLRNKEIAFELGLTEKTVKAYMSTLYRRLGVSSRAQALILLQQVALEPLLQDALARPNVLTGSVVPAVSELPQRC
jgi:DNA-binding NarL/FixJ family response regulator